MKINPLSNNFIAGKTDKVKTPGKENKEVKDKVTFSDGCKEEGCLQLLKKGSFLKAFTGVFSDIAETIGLKEPEEKVYPNVMNNFIPFSTEEPKEWNILVYMAADNNLEESMADNILALEQVGSNENTNIIVQMDRGMRQHKGVSPWDGARRLYITKQDKPEISSEVVEDVGDIDTSKPENLTDFIVWAHKKYPAKHTLIIVSNHGGGFAGIANDDTSKTVMTLPDLGKALKDAKDALGKDKFDIVGFDTCLMGQAEVAYEIRNHANIMIGSEETEGKRGWPYHNIFRGEENVLNVIKAMINTPQDTKVEDLAKKIIDESAKKQENLPTLAAIDLSKMDGIAKSASEFAVEVKKTKGALEKIRKIANKSESYSKVIPFIEPYGQYRDMVDFFQNVIKSDTLNGPEYEAIKKKAEETLSAVKESIIAEQSSDLYKNSHGLSMYIPTDKPKPEKYGYNKTMWAKDTQWDEMLVADRDMMTYTNNLLRDLLGLNNDTWTYSPPVMYDENLLKQKLGNENRPE